MHNEKKNIEDYDWRLQAVTTLKWDQHWWKDGDIVMAIWQFNMNNSEIYFNLPNMSATFLDCANQFFNNSNWYFVFRNFEKDNKRNYFPKDFNVLMRVLQERIWNIVYSFLALESFMNDSIKQEYTYDNSKKIIRTRKGTKTILDQKIIQESISVSDKFRIILPDIYEIKVLEESVLNDFKKIKDLRNKLTHLKEIDKISSWFKDNTIWKILFSKDFINHAIVVKNIIWYFLSSCDVKKSPRWFNKINF